MQSKTESKYVAANAWLESFGDDFGEDADDVYVGDAGSSMKYEDNFDENGMEASPHTGSTHAGTNICMLFILMSF